ncbi:glycosyltransferase [Fibrella aquatilis]|uniref:Glycosyltransferase family 4 protein n=1 Tax=Fibrella aquatilis TaxID=2817059 RepID=A0A939K1Z7_9BACT|nr:glycosyltransferase family 4 protein [Fibrella aquatilis]MBO0933581.1 glycosyltransferase family 4 protein [Fibrella aquatilis]
MKATVALVTDVCFWQEGGGGQARISALVAYLHQHTNLLILYAGLKQPTDETMLVARYGPLNVVYFSTQQPQSPTDYGLLLQTYLLQHPVDVCVLEYAVLTFLLEYIPEGQCVMLDTHDLMSDRRQNFDRFYAPYSTLNVSATEEFALFDKYAYLLLIQRHDYQKVRAVLGEKALLVPHPVVSTQRPARAQAIHIGYVAGASEPNLDAIVWFIREVWPLVYRPGIGLHIYGGICDVLRQNSQPQRPGSQLRHLEVDFPGITRFYESRSLDVEAQDGVVLHGFVPELEQVYAQFDVAINPVRFGSGLKIKNMEALGYGLPLLTTTHGAIGLEDYTQEAMLIADTPADFARQLNRLLTDYPLRQLLGTTAYQLIQTRFSPDACFGGLLAAIQQHSHA